MKSLNKMIASAASMATMCFGAKAESKEVQYGPVSYNGGEIEKIELVNGHILVRSNASVPGCEVPFMYTSTNIQDYASVAFAQGGATNVAQYVHDGNKVYMTFNHTNGVYTTQIADKFGPGVVEQDIPEIDPETGKPKKDANGKTIIKKEAIREVTDENDPIAKAMLDGGYAVTVNNGSVYSYRKDAQGKWTLYKDGEMSTEDFLGGTHMTQDGATPEQIAFADADATGSQKILYVLAKCADNKKRIYTADSFGLNRTEADSISVSDGKLVVQSGKEVVVYDSVNAKKTTVVNGTTGTLPSDVKSVVVAGDKIFYARKQKLGVKTIGE